MHRSFLLRTLALTTLAGCAHAAAPAPPVAPPAAASAAAPSEWASIRQELEATFELDQVERKRAFEVMVCETRPDHPVSEERRQAIWAKVNELDAKNQAVLGRVLEAHGWPPRSRVGSKAELTAFLILQHAPLEMQKKYVAAFRASAARGEANEANLALLEDRIRIRENQPQIYGSQLGFEGGVVTLLPVEDPAHLDERRAKVGLDSICEYLDHFKDQGRVLWPACAASSPAPAGASHDAN